MKYNRRNVKTFLFTYPLFTFINLSWYTQVMTGDYLNIDEFAELVKVHPNTVRRAIKKGRIIAFKVGRVYRIARYEITRMAEVNLEVYIEAEVKKRLGEKK